MATSVLKIETTAGGSPDTYRLIVTNLITGAFVDFEDAGTWSDLGRSTTELRTLLEQVQDDLRRGPSLSRLASAVEELVDHGRQCFYEFVGATGPARAAKIEGLAKDAQEDLRRLDPGAVPQVELEVPPGHFVPVEIFPIFGLVPGRPTADITSIWRVAQVLVGFTASVRRVVSWRSVPEQQTLDHTGRVPISFFWHWGLAGAEKERLWLENNSEVHLNGPWPARRGWRRPAPHVLHEIVNHVVAPPVIQTADGTRLPTAAVHFACHCEAPATAAGRHVLQLGGPYRATTISMPMLSKAAAARHQADPDRLDDGPLGFINACRAAHKTYDQPWSVPRQCLDVLGYRAVVAPVVAIADHHAAELGWQFYDALLSGATVGAALLAARVGLLASGSLSPLGLAYSCYGEADLILRNVRDQSG